MVVVHFEFHTYTIAFSFHKKTDRIIYGWILNDSLLTDWTADLRNWLEKSLSHWVGVIAIHMVVHLLTDELSGLTLLQALLVANQIEKLSEGSHQESVFNRVWILVLNEQDPTQRSYPGCKTYMCNVIWAVHLHEPNQKPSL